VPRIGLIVPSSNIVMEPDFHRHFKPPNLVSTTRIFLEDVTREAEIDMLEKELPRAVRLIRTTAPDVVVFGCTSAGALAMLSHDDGIGRMIEQNTGAGAVTVLRAVLTQLRLLRSSKVAVFTPYVPDLTAGVTRCVREDGHTVVKSVGMGIVKNLDIGQVTPEEIVKFVESQMAGIDADCVFLSCTNWRAIEAIEPLKEKMRLPVVSSNQAAIDAVVAFRKL
jgi:maleate isomerase